MINLEVQWYKVPANIALQQELEPKGQGVIAGQGTMQQGGYTHTTAIVRLENGLLEEKTLDMLQVVTNEPEAKQEIVKPSKQK